MAGPFDDQLILDVTETGTYTTPAGSSSSVAAVSVQESGAQTVFVGNLSLVSRDARIAMGFTQQATRPQECGTYTAADGLIWQIVSVTKHSLGSFWELIGRTFSVPGGLTESGYLQRRNSELTTTKGLSNPTWANLESGVPCLMLKGLHEVETAGESPVGTAIRSQVAVQGYREIRAGDRWYVATASTTFWDVESADPYDASLGVQVLNLRRSV